MSKKKYVNVKDNGTENKNENTQPEEQKKGFFARKRGQLEGFGEKHPKIRKIVKIVLCLLAAIGIGAGGYIAGKRNNGFEGEASTPDLFIPANDPPALTQEEIEILDKYEEDSQKVADILSKADSVEVA